jgi:MFS family permease
MTATILDGRASDEPPARSARAGRYAWYVAGLLSLAHLVSFLDRFVMALVLVPLRAQMHLSDTQLGMLQGLGFVILYCVAGIPLGRLADVANRRWTIIIGIAVWSVGTGACAFASNFSGLFGARVLVGLGEAALVPAAMSLIAAYFHKDKLARAVSIFTMGSPLGKTLALVAGAWLLGSVIPATGLDLPGLGHFRPWQALFLAALLPGFALIALLLFTLKEPPRASHAPTADGRFRAAAAYMVANGGAYALHIAAACCAIILVQAFGAWSPTLFSRVHHLTLSQTGYLVGCVVLVASPLGNLYGGWLTDQLHRRAIAGAPLVAIAAGLILVIPTALALSVAPNVATAAAAFAAVTFFLSSTAGPCLTGIQYLTPMHHRGAVTAIYMCVMTLIAVGLGPTLVGFISDTVFGSGAGIGKALTAASLAVSVLGVTLALIGRRPFQAAVGKLAAA